MIIFLYFQFMEERERLKKSIIEFIDYIEKVEREKGRGNGFFSICDTRR